MGLLDDDVGDVETWRRSVPKMLPGLLVSLPLIAASVALAFGWGGDDYGIFSQVIGWMGTLFFGGAVLTLAWQLLVGDPVVIRVGPGGLHDRRLSPRPIPWESIAGINFHKLDRVRFVTLHMTPEALRLHVRSRPFPQLARWSVRTLGSVTINTIGLDRSFDELVATVNTWYQPPSSRQGPAGTADGRAPDTGDGTPVSPRPRREGR
ncbi:STM3941 family protein [Streptosporangium sp. NPDC000396]|uniref:STM3941 family protein n=1 Tax=Streptosporangium sp. NPDC000396 TaxID=3366185 RepID=UPI0036BD969D